MKKGFIAMTTILILSGVVVAIVATVTLLSIGEAQSAFALMKGENALQFAEGCAEDALLRARSDESYAGGIFAHPGGNCVVDISSDGTVRTMNVHSDATDYSRGVSIVFDRTAAGITLINWREIL